MTNQEGLRLLPFNAGTIMGNQDMGALSSAWTNPSIFGASVCTQR
jgi:hypothetical protein